jgi:Spy/CpxP family protein refolding chaperone
MDRRSFFGLASAIGGLLVGLLGLPAAAVAQQSGPPGGGAGSGFLDSLAWELNLTPAQYKKLQAIYAEEQAMLQKLLAATDAAIRGVLTPAQQKQLADLQSQQMRGSFGGGPFTIPGGSGGPVTVGPGGSGPPVTSLRLPANGGNSSGRAPGR